MTQKLRTAGLGGLLTLAAAAPAHAVQFSPPTLVDGLPDATSFAWGDLDRDGRPDLAAATPDGVVVRLNTTPLRSGSPTFAAPITIDLGAEPVAVRLADVHGDAAPEIITGNSGAPAVSVLRNQTPEGGPLTFANDPVTGAYTPESYDVRHFDASDLLEVALLDGDGMLDIIYGSRTTGRVSVLRNDERVPSRSDFAAPLDVRTATPLGAGVADVVAADVNGEPYRDLVLARTDGNVEIRQGSGNGTALSYGAARTAATGFARLTGIATRPSANGRDDVVVSADNGLSGGIALLPNDGGSRDVASFGAAQPVISGRATDVQVANVDQLGELDVVGSRPNGRAVVALREADKWVATEHNGGTSATQVVARELNGDGDVDVALLDGASDRAAIALQSPDVKTTPTLLEWIEDQAPVVVDPGLTVFAPGGTTELTGATVRVVGAPGDVLELPATPGLTSSYDASARTLTISGAAPVKTYEDALRSVRFSAPGDAPIAGDRTFAFSVRSSIGSPEATRPGKVTSVNDAPGVLLSAPGAFLDPAAGPVPIDPELRLADPDSSQLVRATVTITGGYQAGADRLFGPNDATFDPERGRLTLTSARSLADMQAALRSVSFDTVGRSIDARAVEVRVTDSAGLEGPAAVRTLAFAPQNLVPPGLAGQAVIGQTLSATTGQWRGSAPISYGFRWQRCNAAGGACTDIAGATGTSYVVQAADAGSRLRAVVTADNAAPGSSVAATPPSAVVPAAGTAGAGQGGSGSGTTLPARFAVSAKALPGGRIQLRIAAPVAGRLDVARVRVRRETRLSARRLAVRAGTSTVTLRVTRAARRRITRDAQLTVAFRATWRPQRGARAERLLRVRLTRPIVTARALSGGRIRLTVKAPRAGRVSVAAVRGRLSRVSFAVRRGTTVRTLRARRTGVVRVRTSYRGGGLRRTETTRLTVRR